MSNRIVLFTGVLMERSRSRRSKSARRPAFSLVELVMVVTIIGIIAAIAVPRMSQASTRATANALQATLSNVRKAIDVYYAEHGKYPGYTPGTNAPDGDAFVDQLTMYSDGSGATSATYGKPYVYGPYLRKPFPKNPMNLLDTVHVKAGPADADPADGTVGWVAVLSHGYFGISATNDELDDVLDGDIGRILDWRGGAIIVP
ncbi:MAG: prepilin-type N-terminal cleavage/methylation domain-containing protein [Phycisphaerae bacterium]|jgi:prepilin-type N-terminal cleavage/methylation domain-containing protein